MRFLFPALVSVVALAGAVTAADPPPVFPPIDVQVLAHPRAFVAGGVAHVAYELHVRNLSPRRLTFERIEVRDRAQPSRPALLSLAGEALDAALLRPGAPLDDPDRRVLTAGRTVMFFAWIQAPPHAVPATLTHRVTVRADAPAGTVEINGVDVAVSMKAPRVIAAPLAGDLWLAGNGPDNGVAHRRVLMALSGAGRFPQRFAIDWVRLFPDGRTFNGVATNNRSYRAFGAEALAVADATVVETTDGIPENVPDPTARAVPMTPATIGGNFVLLDLGNETYALYAHLQPGSLRVKKGDRVRRGQIVGLVGNTGNSTEPHLHFQVADRRSPLDAEGIPYGIAAFDLQADPKTVTPALKPLGGSLAIDSSELGRWTSAAASRRENEMPMMNAIVRFQREKPPPERYPRSVRKPARTSSENSCGCSHAAKCPPLSSVLKWTRFG
jgi:murein DD-endopeptidase